MMIYTNFVDMLMSGRENRNTEHTIINQQFI